MPLPYSFRGSERDYDIIPKSFRKNKNKKPDDVLESSLTPVVELPEGSHTVFDMDD